MVLSKKWGLEPFILHELAACKDRVGVWHRVENRFGILEENVSK